MSISPLEAVATQTLTPLKKDYRTWGIQCKAIRSCGERCRRYAIKGGYVCYRHGGQLPVVRASATARIRALADPAVVAIERVLEEGKPAEQLRAARIVLRMCGIGPGSAARVPRYQRAIGQNPTAATNRDAEIETLLSRLLEAGSSGEDSGQMGQIDP